MNQRRSSSRVRTILQGRIVFNERFSLIECTVQDLSDTGAKIAFAHPVQIPPEFEFEIPKKNLSLRARVMWSKGKQHGVMFIEEGTDKVPTAIHDFRSEPDLTPGSPLKTGESTGEDRSVEEILDQARRSIAQTMGIPAETIRLKVEITH